MNDKELLELAAKAAGIELDWDIPPKSKTPWRMTDYGPASEWNPLTDDGDALRLAVKLRLQLSLGTYGDGQEIGVFKAGVVEMYQNTAPGLDVYAATRRAIVRAAAEIGKGMK